MIETFDSWTDSGFPVIIAIDDYDPPQREMPDEPGHAGRVHIRVLTRRGDPADFLRLTESEIERFHHDACELISSQ